MQKERRTRNRHGNHNDSYPCPPPAMPTVESDNSQHRQKDLPPIFPACVARPVSKDEMKSKPKAMEAMKAEWERLWDKGVREHKQVREWSDVAHGAQRAGKKGHMGRLFGLCVEKGSELPPDDPRRKFKYRVVFGGNNVIYQSWESAVFQNLGSSPSSMATGKFVDYYSCLEGNEGQVAFHVSRSQSGSTARS